MPYVARRRVLVLVGDDGRRSAIVRSLEDAELDVQVYELRDAVEELRGEHVVPGLVVLDWHLGGLTGPELLRFIASTPKFVRTRVVVLTDEPAEVPMLCVAATLPSSASATDVLAMVARVQVN